MKTIKQLTLLLFVSTFLASCNIDMLNKIEGNRNVITKKRKVNGDFTKVRASTGLDVYISQGNKSSITVEADENLHDIIKTEVRDGKLRIYSEKGFWRAKATKVFVVVKNVEEIKATSGSDVYSDGVLKVKDIVVSTSSGADMKLELEATSVDASSSSGSDLKILGTTDTFYGSASSGSSTKAYGLKSKDATVKVSSGADLTIYVTESLDARASSGGDIRYKGNPEKINKRRSSGGDIYSRS